MEFVINEIESSLDKCQEFIFNIRKFFRKNPEIADKFIKSLNEKDELIY